MVPKKGLFAWRSTDGFFPQENCEAENNVSLKPGGFQTSPCLRGLKMIVDV